MPAAMTWIHLRFGAAVARLVVRNVRSRITSLEVTSPLATASGKIDSEQLRPIGRLAGPTYSKLGEVVVMRPNRAMDGGEVV